MLPPFRIAIIGAGPGGLLLARMLRVRGLEATIYEQEASLSAREQGGTLDLHAQTGQAALRRAGLFEAFLEFARYEGQHTLLYDKHGVQLAEKPEDEGDRPEIDRRHLRRVLLDSVPEAAIRWDYQLDTVTALDAGGFRLSFARREPVDVDFVVGADGAWSRVRPLLSTALPRYVGSTLYELTINDIDARHPQLAAFVGLGTAFMEGDDKAIIIQRNSNGTVRLYVGLWQTEDLELRGSRSSVLSKEALLVQFDGWGEIVSRLFAAATDAVRPWPIYALPVGHSWKPRAGVTLIGDAAHLMPPAGEGANLALLDAVDLADALADAVDRDAAIRAFEATMFERGEAAATRAMAMLSQGIDVKAVLESGGDVFAPIRDQAKATDV